MVCRFYGLTAGHTLPLTPPGSQRPAEGLCSPRPWHARGTLHWGTRGEQAPGPLGSGPAGRRVLISDHRPPSSVAPQPEVQHNFPSGKFSSELGKQTGWVISVWRETRELRPWKLPSEKASTQRLPLGAGGGGVSQRKARPLAICSDWGPLPHRSPKATPDHGNMSESRPEVNSTQDQGHMGESSPQVNCRPWQRE